MILQLNALTWHISYKIYVNVQESCKIEIILNICLDDVLLTWFWKTLYVRTSSELSSEK